MSEHLIIAVQFSMGLAIYGVSFSPYLHPRLAALGVFSLGIRGTWFVIAVDAAVLVFSHLYVIRRLFGSAT